MFSLKSWVLLLLGASYVWSAEFYVSPHGRDTQPGTSEAPFVTLTRARDAIRQLKASGGLPGPMTVWVHQGDYPLTETFTLTAEDSGTAEAPIVYRACPGEKPVLVGGRPVTGWQPYKDQILQADIRHQGLAGIDFRMLVFNGQRQELARYPNRDKSDLNGGTWAYVKGERISMYADLPDDPEYHRQNQHLDYWQRNIPRFTRTLHVKPEDNHHWKKVKGAEVSVFPRTNWWHNVNAIESFDPNEEMFNLALPTFWEIRPGDRYFVRGLFEELDTPGEWYLDQEGGRLYFWPPEPMAGGSVYAPIIKDIVHFNGCQHVTLQGFTIECGEGIAVLLTGASDCLVAANTIRNVGEYEGDGVKIKDGFRNRIVGNDIYDVGAHGVSVEAGDVIRHIPAEHVIDNNVIHHVGLVGRFAKGVSVNGVGQRVSHNLIHDIPHSGIDMWGPAHTLEYNHIYRTCLESEDTGAISGGAIEWLGWLGVAIRYNYIHDTIGYGYDEQTRTWRSSFFTWAVYPDWAASGLQVVGNIIARAPLGLIHFHSGRDNTIENNILIDGALDQLYMSGWTTNIGYWSTMVDGWAEKYDAAIKHPAWQQVKALVDPRKVPQAHGILMYGNSFRRNIIYYRDPKTLLFHYKHAPLDRNVSDHNLIYHFGHPLRTDQLVLKSEPGPNLLVNPGLEEGTVGDVPKGWVPIAKEGQILKVQVVNDQAHEGSCSLRVDTPEPQPGAKVIVLGWLAMGTISDKPGQVYRLRAWIKGQPGRNTLVSLISHDWRREKTVTLTDQWQQVELIFRLPPEPKPEHEKYYCQLSFPVGSGSVWVDDVSLCAGEALDEWESWQALGMDKNSLIADPLFVDPEHDDYRLKPESPAFKLGFEPIPVDQIGPYADPLRASWPLPTAARMAH